jgi:hypothetical protein
MAISPTFMILLTPSRKALMISMSWIYEIAFLTLQKCFMYFWRLSSGFYLIVFRVLAVEGHSYVPGKFTMNMTHI